MYSETLFQIALPFFLVLAIVYGALEFSGVFKNKGVNAIISLVIALFVISSEPVAAFINQIIILLSVVLIPLFLLGFLFFFFRKQVEKTRDWPLIAILGGLILLLVAKFGLDITQFSELFSSNIIVMLGLVVVVLIFYAAYQTKTQ